VENVRKMIESGRETGKSGLHHLQRNRYLVEELLLAIVTMTDLFLILQYFSLQNFHIL
jgi:hypothetical protein